MASYKSAIEWIASDDDTDWLDDEEQVILSVTASMVSHLWNKDDATIIADIRKARERWYKRLAA